MAALDILDADKWRNVIRDFDAKRVEFINTLSALNATRGANASLEAKRQSLLSKASPIKNQIDALYATLKIVRSWLSSISGIFGGAPQAMSGLGIAPLVLGISVAGAIAIINMITAWLKEAARYNAENKLAQSLMAQGASPQEILKALDKQRDAAGASFFGFDVSGWKGLAILAGVIFAGPFIVKQLQRVIK